MTRKPDRRTYRIWRLTVLVMSTSQCPVILVHGWNSHPGIWNRLIPRLSDASFTVWKFDHSTMDNTDIAKRAAALKAYIRDMRDESGYTGRLIWSAIRLHLHNPVSS